MDVVEYSINLGVQHMIDISELAETYDVTPRAIRYYEELGLLKQQLRESDNDGSKTTIRVTGKA